MQDNGTHVVSGMFHPVDVGGRISGGKCSLTVVVPGKLAGPVHRSLPTAPRLGTSVANISIYELSGQVFDFPER